MFRANSILTYFYFVLRLLKTADWSYRNQSYWNGGEYKDSVVRIQKSLLRINQDLNSPAHASAKVLIGLSLQTIIAFDVIIVSLPKTFYGAVKSFGVKLPEKHFV